MAPSYGNTFPVTSPASYGVSPALLGTAGNILPQGIGVYGQDDPTKVAAFSTFLDGRPMKLRVEFFPQSNWASLNSAYSTIAARWSGADVIWSIPIPADGSIAEVNGGTRDALYTSIFQAILTNTPGSKKIILRLPWEFNLNTQPWFAGGNEANFVTMMRRLVGLARAVSSRFQFLYCVNAVSVGTINVPNCYPGDAYVDIISNDCYFSVGVDSSSSGGTPVFGFFRDNADCGLAATKAFAGSHGKRYGITEWNLSDTVTGYNDSMLDWVYANSDHHHCYWEGSHLSTSARIANGDNPLSAAQYKLRFGKPQITTSATQSSAQNVDASIALTAAYAQTITWTVVSGTASIVGSTLTIPGAPAGNVNVTVRATNQFGLTADLAITQTFTAAYTFVNSEAAAYVARFTNSISETQKSYVDAFWTAIKAGPISGSNLLAKADTFGFGFVDNQVATLNAVSASYGTVVPTNGPTYVSAQGYQGAITGAKYLDMGITFNRSGNVYTNNSACLAAWEFANLASSSSILGNDNIGSMLNPKNGSNNASGKLNGFGTGPSVAMADARGFTAINRSSSSAEQLYKNGVSVATTSASDASGGVSTGQTLYGLSSNSSFPDARIMGAWWMGSSLTANEHKDIYNAYRNLMVSWGVIVAGSFPVAT